MTIYFYKELTRNSEKRSNPVWVFLNIWRLRQVRDITIGTIASNKMLLNAAKCQGNSFYSRENQQGGEGEITPLPPLSWLELILAEKSDYNQGIWREFIDTSKLREDFEARKKVKIRKVYTCWICKGNHCLIGVMNFGWT